MSSYARFIIVEQRLERIFGELELEFVNAKKFDGSLHFFQPRILYTVIDFAIVSTLWSGAGMFSMRVLNKLSY